MINFPFLGLQQQVKPWEEWEHWCHLFSWTVHNPSLQRASLHVLECSSAVWMCVRELEHQGCSLLCNDKQMVQCTLAQTWLELPLCLGNAVGPSTSRRNCWWNFITQGWGPCLSSHRGEKIDGNKPWLLLIHRLLHQAQREVHFELLFWGFLPVFSVAELFPSPQLSSNGTTEWSLSWVW